MGQSELDTESLKYRIPYLLPIWCYPKFIIESFGFTKTDRNPGCFFFFFREKEFIGREEMHPVSRITSNRLKWPGTSVLHHSDLLPTNLWAMRVDW